MNKLRESSVAGDHVSFAHSLVSMDVDCHVHRQILALKVMRCTGGNCVSPNHSCYMNITVQGSGIRMEGRMTDECESSG
jgi:hypothetical protein